MARPRKSTVDALLDEFEGMDIEQQRNVFEKLEWLMGRAERAEAKESRKKPQPNGQGELVVAVDRTAATVMASSMGGSDA